MCGIVGGVRDKNIVPVILNGLSRLEYRGYDSAGVVVIDKNNQFQRERAAGRVSKLIDLCASNNEVSGGCGIGHTRWATHGGVSDVNAHPHYSNNKIAVVHNGIIENYLELTADLKQAGYTFESDTDTEVVAHLIHSLYMKTNDLLMAVKLAIKQLHGAYAIGVICVDQPDQIVCARFGTPLVLGVGKHEMFFASDVSALLPVTNEVVYLEDGDIAKITTSSWEVYDTTEQAVDRKASISKLSATQTDLGEYAHFMQKEIFEQPMALIDTIQTLGNEFNPKIFGVDAEGIFKQVDKVQVIACGTSLNAGHIAKYMIEEFSGIECNIEIASEYRYRKVAVNPNTLIVNISQSGETADTLASVKYAHSLGMKNSLAICNVPESSLVRLSKLHILTQAGPEIGVASTKAFTTQLVVLLYLACTLAKIKGKLPETESKIIEDIRRLPHILSVLLKKHAEIKEMAKAIAKYEHALFLGRHMLYPVATEGALKLKEISYIHAESYATGELKHGPLALIDNKMPCVALMPSSLLADKVASNIKEILARDGKVFLFTDAKHNIADECEKVCYLDTHSIPNYLLPILYTVPLQLLSYYTAVLKGTDVDKPRNLAKSVTVE